MGEIKIIKSGEGERVTFIAEISEERLVPRFEEEIKGILTKYSVFISSKNQRIVVDAPALYRNYVELILGEAAKRQGLKIKSKED